MAKNTIIVLVGVMMCGLFLVGSVLAANGFTIPRSVIGGGGQQATGGDYVLNGTLGEPIASALSIGTNYGLSSGFWWTSATDFIYLPLVLTNNSQ